MSRFYPVRPPRDLAAANDADPQINPGTIIIDANTGEMFQYVKNDEASTALAAGDWCKWKTGTSVLKNAVSGIRPAGRCKSTSIGAGKYGWIQLRGFLTGLSGLTADKNISIGGASGQTVVDTPVGAGGELKAEVIGFAVSATSAYFSVV